MSGLNQSRIFAGLRITSLGALASRILGMVRDMATAALFGLAGEGVMDAFVVALRIPSFFRRLFGEGALTASYLPLLAAKLDEDPRRAWQLASVTLTWLAAVLAATLLLAEAACWLVLWLGRDAPQLRLVAGLAATMMPYMPLICLTALAAATLHAMSHFTTPALAPVVLNIGWLFGVWVVAPYYAPDRIAQAYVVAVCIVLSGIVQLLIQLPPLWRLGFRFQYDWASSRDALFQMAHGWVPMVFGLSVIQVNTALDVLLAWSLSASPQGSATIGWLGHAVHYPTQPGAAAALYYGERLYQFPLGILGIAVATVIFPLLSRHAARGDHEQVGVDLTLGLRLVWFLALPASVGLVILAEPIARLIFERGEFTAEDSLRTGRMIACYGAGVWAYCGLPVLIRGYYATGDRQTPTRIGMVLVVVNLALDLVLIWLLGEVALAATTALTAALQVVLLTALFSQTRSRLMWRDLGRTVVVTAIATGLMAVACDGTLRLVAASGPLVQVGLPLAVSLLVYFAIHRALKGEELGLLIGRSELPGSSRLR